MRAKRNIFENNLPGRIIVFMYSIYYELCHDKTCLWGSRPGLTQTGLYSHRRWLRGLKCQIWDKEELYYLCSENKGVDQVCGYPAADLHLCFRICKKTGLLMTWLLDSMFKIWNQNFRLQPVMKNIGFDSCFMRPGRLVKRLKCCMLATML